MKKAAAKSGKDAGRGKRRAQGAQRVVPIAPSMVAHCLGLSPMAAPRKATIAPTLTPSWFVVHTAPRAEMKVAQDLEALGYQTFVPTRVKWGRIPRHRRHRAGHRHKVELPLFLRYVFVGFDPEAGSFYPIRLTEGVKDILSNKGQPMKLQTVAIDRMRQACARGDFDATIKEAERLAKLFTIGAELAIPSGPFAGFVGTIRAARRKFVEVEISMFGRPTPVDVPVSALADSEIV